jgi:MFS family permease
MHTPAADIVETDTPARLDRLPWGRFHTLVVVALGVTWILDGLEVTLAGALSGALKESPTLQFSNADVGFAASAYLAGAVVGAIFFGWLTDRLGRKKLFFITVAVYLVATAATALSWNVWSFAPGPTSPSTAASGSAPPWARPARSCCSTPRTFRPISAGAWRS